jgi:hypothetical protein
LLVPAYADKKLHDITNPADPAEAEALDMNWFVVTEVQWGQPPIFNRMPSGSRK